MRLLFEINETGDEDLGSFEEVQDALVRLVAEREEAEGRPVNEFAVAVALEYRHQGTEDGRLALWRTEHVRALLREWFPRKVTLLPDDEELTDERVDAPAAVTALVGFLDAAGILDPRSDSPQALYEAAAAERAGWSQDMFDPRFMGTAKFLMLSAAEQGVDVRDEEALDGFLARVRDGRGGLDEERLSQIAQRQRMEEVFGAAGTFAGAGSLLRERTPVIAPVVLAPLEELREQARGSVLLGQLATLVHEVGANGRSLTKTGRLRVADARELARRLDTTAGLPAEGTVHRAPRLPHLQGDDPDTARTADGLPSLSLLVAWATTARLIRVHKGRLVAVAKARKDVDDPAALAVRAVRALPELREQLLPHPSRNDGEGLLGEWSALFPRFADLLADLLAALYGMPVASPWPTLWATVRAAYLDDPFFGIGDDKSVAHAENHLRGVVGILEDLGVVQVTRGRPDPGFSDLVRSGALIPPGERQRQRALQRALLGTDVELLALTPLGTHAVRELLLSLGRHAPAVGALRDEQATLLLHVLLDEYGTDSARAELATWNGTSEQLLHAVRAVRLHSRRAAALHLLLSTLPDARGFTAQARQDPELAPAALLAATDAGHLDVADLDEREIALITAESLLLLTELSGDEDLRGGRLTGGGAVRGQHLGGLPLTEMIELALASGHPDTAGLDRLRRIDLTPLARRPDLPGRLRAAQARKRHRGSSGKGRGKGKRRGR
ncbi:hypothetical protein GCM10019016_037300 [Streptomyces prasinosporus]|uniref:Uncharacterized protein n=1 Tax=Streptomyces prasinosporus TaxID=68256 RepID=A0ABP6TPA7_9ACTN